MGGPVRSLHTRGAGSTQEEGAGGGGMAGGELGCNEGELVTFVH